MWLRILIPQPTPPGGWMPACLSLAHSPCYRRCLRLTIAPSYSLQQPATPPPPPCPHYHHRSTPSQS